MSAGLLGCMTTPAQGNRIPDGAMYACDNGKFGADGKGKNYPGDELWFEWLSNTVERYGPERCLWAVAPDVPFDAVGTLDQSRPWLAKIRKLGIHAAFAAQDGCEMGLIPWGEFDVLFIAGSTEWKIGPIAGRLTTEAKARGLDVHMGRVNSQRRMTIASTFGCDSVDGTYIAYGPDVNLPDVLDWLTTVNDRMLPIGEAS